MESSLSVQLQQLQKKLKTKKIASILVTDPFNVRYLTNFTGTNGQLLITPTKAFFMTDFRYLAVAKKILPKEISLINMSAGLIKTLEQLLQKNSIDQLFFEEKNITYYSYRIFKEKLAHLKLEPIQDIVEDLRLIKKQNELKYIIKAQRIAEKVFIEVRKNLQVGKTEMELATEIEKLSHEYGADGISFPSIVGFNENSASPHHQSGTKKLQKGDVILIDMGMQYKGYCSDMTRMIFTKTPTAKQKKIYNIVLEAQEKSTNMLKNKVKGFEVDQCARDIITKAGYGETFGHSLGHGIGLEVHEGPTLSKSFDGLIPAGTIVTVEPGIYLENSFGVRIEDMLLINSNGVTNLTKIPKKIEDTIFPVS